MLSCSTKKLRETYNLQPDRPPKISELRKSHILKQLKLSCPANIDLASLAKIEGFQKSIFTADAQNLDRLQKHFAPKLQAENPNLFFEVIMHLVVAQAAIKLGYKATPYTASADLGGENKIELIREGAPPYKLIISKQAPYRNEEDRDLHIHTMEGMGALSNLLSFS